MSSSAISRVPRFRSLALWLVLISVGGGTLHSQPSPAAAVRNKIAAGDLLSAESVLDVHRETKGEDDLYLVGLGWLARGALLTGDLEAAGRYAAKARSLAEKIVGVKGFEAAPDAVGTLGAALEVEAQLLDADGKQNAAVSMLRLQLTKYASAPVAFRSRLQKRMNLMSMEGDPAPAITPEQQFGPAFPALSSLRGSPVVLYFWAEWCGDCKAQAKALRMAMDKYGPKGVRFLAVTRYYKEANEVELERARQQWKESYPGLEQVPVAISTAAMERYGVSSTPTFGFVDREGRVQAYHPSRLTTERLREEIDRILK